MIACFVSILIFVFYGYNTEAYSNGVIDLFEHIGDLNTKRRENRCYSVLPSIGQDRLTQLVFVFSVEIIHEQPPQYDRLINFSKSEIICLGIVVSVRSGD